MNYKKIEKITKEEGYSDLTREEKKDYLLEVVTYSHHLRSGGFSLEISNLTSINELSPHALRFLEKIDI